MVAEHKPLSLDFRPAAMDDLEGIGFIDQQSFARPWSRRMFREELSADDRHLYGVFQPQPDRSPLLLGFICFHSCLDEATLIRIAVHPDHRRRGIASFLIRKMMTELKGRQVAEIFLEVGASNHAARNLYRSFEFQPVGRRPDYYAGTREDALIMKAIV